MEPKISRTTFVLMLTMAITADIVMFIPVINIFAGIFFGMLFWFWFALKGLGWKGAALGGAGAMFELVPLFSLIPQFTAMIIAVYVRSRSREIAQEILT